ncbi:class I SAM-dependent methyltransferase [Amycolatopsis balhimycina DSM 5908]|uniref:Class I SAM-dependent methyltransferase n=2 Tax=Amycolatopsis balhimycina TaxID=208443 RepID=A0A428WP42_AMYBA|nr:class I SAM-dependent methyltransferase [Amycolatopsis balhimycina]RSM44865.1 class I SAM-dependent methyltransferase [Amycolatopsis balhimycina DSM 5908]
MARAGQALISNTAPNGKAYWAGRFWDRDSAERHPVLAGEFLKQKQTIAGYLDKYGRDAERSIEFACGTGEFTRLTAEHTGVRQMRALDISAQGLQIARSRVRHDNITFQQGDFWADHDFEPAELVLCIDAIHHLGNIGDVLRHIRRWVEPGGIFIGNLFTGDNFHEFERKRYGSLEHLWRTTLFFGTALAIKVSGGRLYTGSHRTQLLPTAAGEQLVRDVFDEVLEVSRDPYFTAFVARA